MAAAFAALVSLEHNLHLIQSHPRHSFSFEPKQIQSLLKIVASLIDFMKSYDNSHEQAAAALERRIARAAQAAEDVIESHVVDQIRAGKTRRSKTTSSRFLLDLQKVIDDVDYMRRKAINVKSQSRMDSAAAVSSTPRNRVKLTSKKNSMVGFDDVLLLFLDKLTALRSSCQVIPIVGMGGIGKTTLARNAFEHPLIAQHFDVCLWSTISQQYRVEKILVELLSSLKKKSFVDESTSSGNANEVRESLHKSLYGRRYLIVLDDMWSLEAWDEIKFFFPDTDNGSRIVVTTRHSDVADHLGSSSLAMSFLDEESSWDLFCQEAFAKQSFPPELVEIGKKIVEKCRGLPLAIVVVGGHLRKSSMTREYWENVAHHMMNSTLNSMEIDEHCLYVLSLSYSYLPIHLKPCFLLMGAFQEDEEIYVWDLLKLWIAEGFIQPCESTRLEVTAEEYLEDLLERNLIILVNELGFNGEIEYFKLHDLLRELCLRISKEEEFLHVLDTPQAISRERRVVINEKILTEINQQTRNAPIRCLICEGGRLSCEFKLLRVLKKVDSALINQSIFQQVNLRYLIVDLDHRTRRTLYLPSSISLLWNLQILTITVPNLYTIVAPQEIWEMLQLRHLEIDPVCLLDPLPSESSNQENDLVLRDLSTLSKVENFRLSDEVCKRIANIRELQLTYCDEATSYYCPHNLGNFHELQSLVCEFHGNSAWREFTLRFTFPSSLLWLYLSGCRLDWEDVAMTVGSLPNLVSLQLYPNAVIGSVWTPVEGNFLCLKNLDICGCDDLVYWNADSSHFPVLENLHLRKLCKLDEVPSGMGEIPTLRWIQMEFCSESSTISAMRILMEREEEGNEGLELYVSFQGDDEVLGNFNNRVREEGLRSNNLFIFLRKNVN